ncbi:hypothetical protein ACFWBH_04015 [Streptomyces sp. NPDC059999]|uniref:hypothetical protein n=1 Tax=unclassified Streptomyces TaxID=2593676 RepID=UPI002E339F28|nr:hypothetical protein [Streptomyces sp. NBC_01426]
MSTIGTRGTAVGFIGLAVVGLALTGCKSGNEEQAPAPASPSAAQPSKPAQPDTSATPPAGGGDVPAPGTAGTAKSGQSFKIGEAATVPFKYGTDKAGTIALTVTGIEQGQAADLAALKLGDKVKGMVPYYIRYSVKNVGTTDLSHTSVGHIKGLLPDGSEAQGLSIIGTFEKCDDDSLPRDFTNGKSQTNCAVALAPSAQTKVVGAEYWGDPYNSLKDGKSLTWK